MNAAADFLCRAEIITTERLEMSIRYDVTTQAIEANIQSTGVADEETIYLLPEENPREQQLWQEKKHSLKQRKQKLTMTQKMKRQNFKIFINPPREQLITKKGTSKTSQKSV